VGFAAGDATVATAGSAGAAAGGVGCAAGAVPGGVGFAAGDATMVTASWAGAAAFVAGCAAGAAAVFAVMSAGRVLGAAEVLGSVCCTRRGGRFAEEVAPSEACAGATRGGVAPCGRLLVEACGVGDSSSTSSSRLDSGLAASGLAASGLAASGLAVSGFCDGSGVGFDPAAASFATA